jgi:hypothetical protein
MQKPLACPVYKREQHWPAGEGANGAWLLVRQVKRHVSQFWNPRVPSLSQVAKPRPVGTKYDHESHLG